MKVLGGPPAPVSPKFNIQFVTAKKISHLCCEPGNSIYCLEHHSIMEDDNTSQHLSNPHSSPLSDPYSVHTSSLALESMSEIPVDYHEFHDVFSDTKANMLPPHQSYDLQISLEEGAKPFHSPIYSLSPLELMALQEFLEEHTQNGFICPTKSLWGSPVLFIKHKDRTLPPPPHSHPLTKATHTDHHPPPP